MLSGITLVSASILTPLPQQELKIKTLSLIYIISSRVTFKLFFFVFVIYDKGTRKIMSRYMRVAGSLILYLVRERKCLYAPSTRTFPSVPSPRPCYKTP